MKLFNLFKKDVKANETEIPINIEKARPEILELFNRINDKDFKYIIETGYNSHKSEFIPTVGTYPIIDYWYVRLDENHRVIYNQAERDYVGIIMKNEQKKIEMGAVGNGGINR